MNEVDPSVLGKTRNESLLRKSQLGALAFILLSQSLSLSQTTLGPLRVSKLNTRYFCDASDNIVYLAGTQSGGWDIQDDCWSGYCSPGVHIQADFGRILKLAKLHNQNFIRLWIVESTLYDKGPKDIIAHPMPFLRTGPGPALDGRPKFDLTRFDQEYFDRLRSAVIAARDEGIYVSVMLFERFSSVHVIEGNIANPNANPWFGHPFNAGNNINSIDADANGNGHGAEFHSLATPAVTELQKAYVRKVIDTVNDLDNVLYEIANESLATSKEWQYEMIRTIKDYEAAKPKQHPVMMSGVGRDLELDVLLASPADAIAPPGGPPVATGSKVSFADHDHNGWRSKDPGFAWKSFLNGHNVIIFDMHSIPFDWVHGKIARDDGSYEPLRKAVGQTRDFASRMNMAEAAPLSNLSSTSYCLASPGKEYLTYQPKSGEISLELLAGDYIYEWYDPTTGKTSETGSMLVQQGQRQLMPPFPGPAILYLKSKGTASSLSGSSTGNTVAVNESQPGQPPADSNSTEVQLAPGDLDQFFQPPANYAGDFGTFRSPLEFDDGRKVKTAQDWQSRRQEILDRWHKIMGPWPPLVENPAVEILKSEQRDNFTQHHVRLQIAPDRFTEDAYLLVPEGEGPFPAMVVVYYDSLTGIGQGKAQLRDFASQLARRGFVALSLGSPPATFYPAEETAQLQPLSFHAYVAANCWQALANRPDVDSKRIGIVGHSYGGKWAMFASCLFDKFACAAWSDGGVVFDETRPNVNYWEPWYLGHEPGKPQRARGIVTKENPRTGAYKTMVEQGLDLHELHALMAPRPFLVSGGAEDRPERWTALNHAIAVNNLLGHSNCVAMTNRDGHGPTPLSNAQIYLFFERILKRK